jgi:hypothetical protein
MLCDGGAEQPKKSSCYTFAFSLSRGTHRTVRIFPRTSLARDVAWDDAALASAEMLRRLEPGVSGQRTRVGSKVHIRSEFGTQAGTPPERGNKNKQHQVVLEHKAGKEPRVTPLSNLCDRKANADLGAQPQQPWKFVPKAVPTPMMMGKVTITPIASSLEMKNIDTMLPHACVRLRSPCEITCLKELLNAAVSDDSRSMISPVWCVSKKARS